MGTMYARTDVPPWLPTYITCLSVLPPPHNGMIIQSSSPSLFLFPVAGAGPVPAFLPGPQYGVGFIWYLRILTLEDEVTELGWCLKFASALGQRTGMSKRKECVTCYKTHFGSLSRRWNDGEFGEILSL